MIKFILYDDEEETFTKTSSIINKIMMKYECDYRIEKFTKYDYNLEKFMKHDDSQKIYLLDIEVPRVTGLDLATKIRKHDWNSIIIFLTAYEQYKKNVFSERLMIFDYICKDAKYEKQLEECIKTSIVALEKNNRLLKYKFNSITYRIPINEILYIVKVPFNKKCTIYTIKNERYEIGGTIEKVKQKLGKEFKQSHKSCIVNVENIKLIDSCSNIITFKNGKTIDLLSTRMRKSFEDYVLNYKD